METIIRINDAVNRFAWGSAGLALLLGTGNIAGVTTAICFGGPGAVFWMWIAALLGMMVKYSENVLGKYYRRRNSEGAWSGGPMYYLEDGLGGLKHCKKAGRILGILFCVFTMLASFGIGNMAQINKITINVEATFLSGKEAGRFWGASNVNWASGIFLMLATAAIILGGFRRHLIPLRTAAREVFSQTKQGWGLRLWFIAPAAYGSLSDRDCGE